MLCGEFDYLATLLGICVILLAALLIVERAERRR